MCANAIQLNSKSVSQDNTVERFSFWAS